MSEVLVIEDVPEEIGGRLRAQAARHHRSLQNELLAIIEKAVAPVERFLTIEEVQEQARLLLPNGSASEAADIIRADRDRDDHRH